MIVSTRFLEDPRRNCRVVGRAIETVLLKKSLLAIFSMFLIMEVKIIPGVSSKSIVVD